MRALLAAVALGLVLTVTGGAGAQSPTLFGTVGPGFFITLVDGAGNPVRQLDPGTYTIQIEDKADIHNFHLTGPGVDKATSPDEMGTFTWTVTFVDGKYHFQCDPHALTMKGDLTAGTPPPTTTTSPPPTTTTSPPPVKKPVTLAATVGPGTTIALKTPAGKKVTSLKAGAVLFKVNDRSAKDNFHLVGPGVNRATSKPGRATVTWRLTLKRGLYMYRSDATARLRGTLRAV